MQRYELKFKENPHDLKIKVIPSEMAEKTQEISRIPTVKQQKDDKQDAVVEIRFLARSWLDDFEKEVFNGKTVEELLDQGKYD